MKSLYPFLSILFLSIGLSVTAVAEKTSIELATSFISVPDSTTKITVVNNRILVNDARVGSRLEVFSVVGIKVKEIEMKQPSGEYAVNLPKGYYIIRLDEVVQKVAIR